MASNLDAQLARLRARLEAIPNDIREAVKPALLTSGAEIVESMKHLAPHDTGALAESITFTPGGQATPPYSQPGGTEIVPDNAIRITVGDEHVRYAHLVEYGTAEAHAQPFFWPAWRLGRTRVKNRITRAIRKAVREHGAKV